MIYLKQNSHNYNEWFENIDSLHNTLQCILYTFSLQMLNKINTAIGGLINQHRKAFSCYIWNLMSGMVGERFA